MNDSNSGHTKHDHHHKSDKGGYHNHHAHMAQDFLKQFWITIGLTIPILILYQIIQELLELGDALQFAGDIYLPFVLLNMVFFLWRLAILMDLYELKDRQPSMMTLSTVIVAINAWFLNMES